MNIPANLQAVTRENVRNTTISTKGKVIDAQYEIFKCTTVLAVRDPESAIDNIDGLFINPGFTISEWLNCQ